MIIALFVAILIGATAGLVSGFVVTNYGLPSFIMTLAMMTIARGATFIYTGGFPSYNIGQITVLGKGDLLSVPIRVIVMIVVCVFSGTLCTGSRDPNNMWRTHPDNDTPEAWRDLLVQMEAAACGGEDTE